METKFGNLIKTLKDDEWLDIKVVPTLKLVTVRVGRQDKVLDTLLSVEDIEQSRFDLVSMTVYLALQKLRKQWVNEPIVEDKGEQ